MRILLFVLWTLLAVNPVTAQTERQQGLVSAFFRNSAAAVVAGMAHPLSTRQGCSISHDGHRYYVTINYTYGNEYFSCTHVFDLSPSGNPTGYRVWQCNAPGFWKCFEGLGLTKNIIGYFSEQEKETLPRILGKALSEISVEDACFGRLYYSWNSGGYYQAY